MSSDEESDFELEDASDEEEGIVIPISDQIEDGDQDGNEDSDEDDESETTKTLQDKLLKMKWE